MSLSVVFLLASSLHAQVAPGPCVMRAEDRGCAPSQPAQFGATSPMLPRVAPGTVSVKSLRADPNGKAARELEQALWDVKYKNWKSAVKHFEKALKADESFSRASANWGILEIQLGNAAKAESIARRALAHDPKNLRLKHVLGASLFAQGVLTDETVTAFAAAGAESPQALLAAAHIEFQRGNWSSVRKFAKAYLTTGEKEHREFAERLRALPDTAK